MGRRPHRVIDQPILDLATHPAPYMTTYVLAEYLEVHPRTIQRMILAGSLHAFKVGKEWRIPTAEAQQAFPGRRAMAWNVPRGTNAAH